MAGTLARPIVRRDSSKKGKEDVVDRKFIGAAASALLIGLASLAGCLDGDLSWAGFFW